MRDEIRRQLLENLEWRCIGPHRGGRVVAVAGDVSQKMTFYMGACAGGVWKTTDGGTYWHNISDGYFKTAAIGALAVSASDPNVIYAGTGESTIRGNVSHGDGVYKSLDAGMTWGHVGLSDSRHIGKILIHPRDPDHVYVAAFGHAFGPNEERGVFRSLDGGGSWEKVLYKSERAGSHDVALDVNNPRIMFAAIWQAQRYPHKLENGGPDCGLWRSFDGGDSWQLLTHTPGPSPMKREGGNGLPTGLLGKIGVALSPVQAGRVWACIEAEDGAVFRSDDYGESWIRLSEQSLLRTRPWYYMHVTADTQDPDTVYIQNYSLWKSIDGGASFETMPTPHGDEHALWIDPADNRRMIRGNDGGACVSFNAGRSWSSIYNQPTAQLYHVCTDDRFPYRVYGSQQDNTAITVPSATADGAIHERDWYAPGGGESGYIAVKPDDPDIVVGSGPTGQRAYNDHMTLYNHRTGQKWINTVWPELYGWGVGAERLKYRFQWTFPIMFSRHDPDALYACSQHLHRSTDLGASWEVVSPDLTRNDPDKLKASGGPITRDNTGAEVYCNIFALAECPHEAGVLWAGSDDGLLHISRDAGETWREITPPDLPEWALISIIDASAHQAGAAYVAATRYKLDDCRPYLYKTTDYGASWTAITNGIPNHEFTRVIREDPARRGLLYAGTETGIYISFDDGANWRRLGGNLPVCPIHDLVIKDCDLVLATHGRSFWILDDLSALRQAQGELAEGGAHLFAPAPKVRMRAYSGFGGWDVDYPADVVNYGGVGTSVAGFTRRPGSDRPNYLNAGHNPRAGIVFWYHLADVSLPKEGGRDVPQVVLNIRKLDGELIRRYRSGEAGGPSAAAGINRFEWNMRYPGAVEIDGVDGWWERPDGPLVTPGEYVAELEIAGEILSQRFEVRADPRVEATGDDLEGQRNMLLEIRDRLSQNNELVNRLVRLKRQVGAWAARADDASLQAAAAGIASEVERTLPLLINVGYTESQLYASGLHEKYNALFESVDSADYAPPQQAREVFAQLGDELDGHVNYLRTDLGETVADFNAAVRELGLEAVDAV
ncbi:MAG: glycosyl hydrolase [Chloroflexota bacterium]|nr:glycosyl hydrolase [Chloroflexota bacterium]MDE2945623.1 glycosyl hydrolase [Chloroflexota bacterium]